MSQYPILVAPHPSLKQPSQPIVTINQQTHTIVENLLETMYAANAIGLSAPQVNILQRIVVIDVETSKQNPFILINPHIVEASKETMISNEGCLSFPDIYLNIPRSKKIHIQYYDLNATLHSLESESSLLTCCIQHEIDHLNGILFIDYISCLRQSMILRKMRRIQQKIPLLRE